MKKKIKILCVCSMGLNRSKYLASYLKKKGYETRYGGIGPTININPMNPFKKEDIDWADVIITARLKHKPLLRKKYKIKNKKIISLDVSDSRGKFEEKHPDFEKLGQEVFDKKWTRPQLRKAIKLHLPLKLK